MRHTSIFSLLTLLSIVLCLSLSAFAGGTAYGEWRYDRGFTAADEIFRIERDIPASSIIRRVPITDPELAGLLDARFQAVNGFAAGRLSNGRSHRLYHSEARERVAGEGFGFDSDASIADVFGLEVWPGSVWNRDRRDFVFLSRSLATRLHGDPASAIGRLAYMGKDEALTIAGVFDDLPPRSHINFDILRPHPDLFRPSMDTIDLEALAASPTGLVADVIDTMTYLRVPNNIEAAVEAALQDIETRRALPTFSDMRLIALTDIYFSNVPTRGGRTGDWTLFVALVGGALIFYAMAASQLKLLIVNGHHARRRVLYLLKTLGYTPSSLAVKGLAKLASLLFFLLFGTMLVLVVLNAETRSSLGWSSTTFSEQPAGFAAATLAALILLIGLAMNVSELSSIFKKPYAVLRTQRQRTVIKSLPLQLGVLLNFAIVACLMCVLLSLQSQINRSAAVDRGFNPDNAFIIEGWREANKARDALDQSALIQPIVSRLDSRLGAESVALASTVLDSAHLPREVFLRENGISERFQTVYITPNFFRLLNIPVLDSLAGNDPMASLGRAQLEGVTEGTGTQARKSPFPVFVSHSLASYLEAGGDGPALGRKLSHSSGSRAEISAIVGDIVTGDPELSDPRLLYIVDQRRAPNIIIKARAEDDTGLASVLAMEDFGLTLFPTPLLRMVNESLDKKFRRRDFIVIIASVLAMTALLASLNLFLMMLHQGRKEIVIRQVYGFTFWPLLTLWFPRMIWPIAAGCVVGVASMTWLPQSPELGVLIRGLTIEHRVFVGVILILLTAILLAISLMSLCRRIDLQALRDDGLAT